MLPFSPCPTSGTILGLLADVLHGLVVLLATAKHRGLALIVLVLDELVLVSGGVAVTLYIFSTVSSEVLGWTCWLCCSRLLNI